jgi:hypothetical protein
LAINLGNLPEKPAPDVQLEFGSVPPADSVVLDSTTPRRTADSVAMTARALPMDGKSAAGVNLTRFVLWTAAISIGLLLLLLAWADDNNRASANQAYSLVHRLAESARPGADRGRAEGAVARIEAALEGNPLTEAEARELRGALEALLGFPNLPARQRDSLTACIGVIPQIGRDAQTRQAALSCTLALDWIRREAATPADAERIRQVVEFARDVNAHRAEFRSFWLQAAQLVLLNLLLPVLTALLGYIFGSREAQGAARRDNEGG